MIKEGKKVHCAIIYNELFGETGIVKQAGTEESIVNFNGKDYVCNNSDLQPCEGKNDREPAELTLEDVPEHEEPEPVEEPKRSTRTAVDAPDFVKQNHQDPEAAFKRQQSAERHLREWMQEVAETNTWGMAESTQSLYGLGKEIFEAIITDESNTACRR